MSASPKRPAPNAAPITFDELQLKRIVFSPEQLKIAENILKILQVKKTVYSSDFHSEYFVEMIAPLLLEIKQIQKEREKILLTQSTFTTLDTSRNDKRTKLLLPNENKLFSSIVDEIKMLLNYKSTDSGLITPDSIFNFVNKDPAKEQEIAGSGRIAQSLHEYLRYNRFLNIISGEDLVHSNQFHEFIFKPNSDLRTILKDSIIIMIDLNVIALKLFFSLVDNICDACTLLISILTQSLDTYKALNLFDYDPNDSDVEQPPYFSINIESLRLISLLNNGFINHGYSVCGSPTIIDNKLVQQLQRRNPKSKIQPGTKAPTQQELNTGPSTPHNSK